MKISVNDFQELIENENYATKSVALKEKSFKKDIHKELENVAKFGEDSLDSGRLFEYQINVGNTTFLIQSGIINLPFQDYKKISNFFEDGQIVETKIYLVTKSEFINKSKLRIEKISDNSEINNISQKEILEFMQNQLETIMQNEIDSESVEK